MLPRSNRLTKKKDFQEVFQKGKSIQSTFLVFKVLKSPLGESRFGFVVSKKVSNKATIRNTVKRRLRKAIGDNLQEFLKPVDVVIIALPSIKNQDFLAIEQVIVKTSKRI